MKSVYHKPKTASPTPDFTWCRVEFKGRTERWCRITERKVFGVNMICCEQPFEDLGTRTEFFNADAIFRLTIHSEERVRRELHKLEIKWQHAETKEAA